MALFKTIPASRLTDAARKAGTPLYCYHRPAMEKRYKALSAALPENWRLYFAVKANPNVAVLEVYRKLGARAECASAGEVAAARKAGFTPADIALSGPVKGREELALLSKRKADIVHAESTDELNDLNRLKTGASVALRINPDFTVKQKEGLVMVGGREKFGFSVAEALNIVKQRDKWPGLDIKGFHIYLGTQIASAKAWLKGVRQFINLVKDTCGKTGFAPTYLNVGGGLGVPYRDGDSDFNLGELKRGLKKLKTVIDKEACFANTRFYIEPGRYLIGPAGVYLMEVTGLKTIRGVRYALTDGGIHHALFPFRVSRTFPVRLLNRRGGAKKQKYILGGPLCTSLDQSDLPVSLPELKQGDLLGIYMSGAYGYTASMQMFLSHPLPAEVMLEKGRTTLIRKRSLSAHLFAHQTYQELG